MFIQLYNKERKDNKWAKSLKKNDNNNNRKKMIVKRKKKYKVEFHDNIIIKDKKKTVSSQPKLGYQTCNLDCVAEPTS